MLSRRISITAPAQEDLRSISHYSEQQWGAEHAASYTDMLLDNIDLLLTFSELGLIVRATPPELRRIGSGSHYIYYRVHKTKIEIVRVIHESADQDVDFD